MYKNFTIITILLMIVLAGCSMRILEAPYNENSIWGFNGSESYKYLDDEFSSRISLLSGTDNVFSTEYSKQAGIYIDKLKSQNEYSISSPLFIYNPYGITSGVLYVYMGEGNANQYIKYSISVPDYNIPDFTASCYISSSIDRGIEGSIAGVIPGRLNTINIKIMDEIGSVLNESRYDLYISKNIEYGESILASDIMGNDIIMTQLKSGSTAALSGLYCTYDTTKGAFLFYDNNGIKRAEILTENILDNGIMFLQADNMLFYADSPNSGVLYNRFSEAVLNIKVKEGYEIVSYDYDSNNKQILMLCQSLDDIMLASIDINKMEYNEEASLTDMGYLSSLEGMTAESGLSIRAADNNDIILFMEDKASVIKIDNSGQKLIVRWLFSKQADWDGLRYYSILLRSINSHKMGNIVNVNLCPSKKMEDNFSILGIISLLGSDVYYNKFTINESNNTYDLLSSIKLEGLSSSQEACFTFYGEHIIVTEKEGSFIEYNHQGKQLAKFTTGQKLDKVFKYSMSRYWF